MCDLNSLSPPAQVQIVVQDALSDAGATFQKYSQKASKLTGGQSKRSDSGYMQTSDVYESNQSSCRRFTYIPS